MKLYSNIHNQPEKNPQSNQTPKTNTIPQNQSYNALNLPQHSEVSNLQQESIKPLQLGLTALNLYMLPSHISVVDEEHKDSQFQRVVGAATRSTTPRKKIFNQENILFKIMEPVSEHIKQQITTKSTRNKSQMYEPQPPKDLTSYIQPREKTKMPQTTNQMFDRRLDQSMRKINKGFQPQTKDQKEQAYRILAGPILHEERQSKPHTLAQSMHPQLSKSSIQLKIPEMLQRMDRNERAILQLKNQVTELIRLENEKNINFKKDLSSWQRLMEQKHSNLKSQVRQLQIQQEFKIERNIRNQLQKQQANRIQELIEENKLLTQKISEQRANHRKTNPKQDIEHLRNKIAHLELQREAIERDRTKNLRNLDISVIPQREQYYIPKPQLMVPTNQPPHPLQPIIIRYPQLNQSYRVNEQSTMIPDYRYHNLGIREIKVTKMF